MDRIQTFEQLLNKEEENFPIPDFNSIEIKTIRNFSKKNIHLFNVTPDGEYLFPIKRVLNILGYPDKVDSKNKIFNMAFNSKSYTNIGFYKKAKLIVNKEKQKIELIAFDTYLNNLNLDVSWSFDLLKERLYLKLKKLAIITANTKTMNNKEFFYYNQIKMYKLRGFNTFISLIENGDIIITFKIGVFRSGKRLGQIHDRGTSFSIKLDKLDKLYEEVLIS